jgi:hypothetical protein
MAIKNSEIESYNKTHTKSVTDRDGAKTANRGGGSGVKLRENDVLHFEVSESGLLDVRKNTEFKQDGSYTCLVRLERNGNSLLVEAWESFFTRTIIEYDKDKVPTGKVFECIPLFGADTTNPLDFWDAYAGKSLKVKEVKRVNTLNYEGTNITPKPFYEWEDVTATTTKTAKTKTTKRGKKS